MASTSTRVTWWFAFLAFLAFLAGVGIVSLFRPSGLERRGDDALVKGLLQEDLGNRSFPFPTVIEAATGHKVIALNKDSPTHATVAHEIETAVSAAIKELSAADSPIRGLRRINEASHFFEDAIRTRLDSTKTLRCTIPSTGGGDLQRSGYPDLRIVHEPSGEVFYLDPKLVEAGSERSTLRTFYFEPRVKTGKIHDHAVHLLVGIIHDGSDGAWTFSGFHLVDLSKIQLRLKAEFQASNADLYPKTALPTPPASR